MASVHSMWMLQVLASVRTTQLNALKNRDLPFTKLVEALGVTRSSSYTPVFQAMLALNEGGSAPGSSANKSNLNFKLIASEVDSLQHLCFSTCWWHCLAEANDMASVSELFCLLSGSIRGKIE